MPIRGTQKRPASASTAVDTGNGSSTGFSYLNIRQTQQQQAAGDRLRAAATSQAPASSSSPSVGASATVGDAAGLSLSRLRSSATPVGSTALSNKGPAAASTLSPSSSSPPLTFSDSAEAQSLLAKSNKNKSSSGGVAFSGISHDHTFAFLRRAAVEAAASAATSTVAETTADPAAGATALKINNGDNGNSTMTSGSSGAEASWVVMRVEALMARAAAAAAERPQVPLEEDESEEGQSLLRTQKALARAAAARWRWRPKRVRDDEVSAGTPTSVVSVERNEECSPSRAEEQQQHCQPLSPLITVTTTQVPQSLALNSSASIAPPAPIGIDTKNDASILSLSRLRSVLHASFQGPRAEQKQGVIEDSPTKRSPTFSHSFTTLNTGSASEAAHRAATESRLAVMRLAALRHAQVPLEQQKAENWNGGEIKRRRLQCPPALLPSPLEPSTPVSSGARGRPPAVATRDSKKLAAAKKAVPPARTAAKKTTVTPAAARRFKAQAGKPRSPPRRPSQPLPLRSQPTYFDQGLDTPLRSQLHDTVHFFERHMQEPGENVARGFWSGGAPPAAAAAPHFPSSTPYIDGLVHAPVEHLIGSTAIPFFGGVASHQSSHMMTGQGVGAGAQKWPPISPPPQPLQQQQQQSLDDTSAPPGKGARCVVFDTSSLIESEPSVLNLLTEKWVVCIPFKVVDELDKFNKDKLAGRAKLTKQQCNEREWRTRRAREVRNWIAAALERKDGHIRMQKRTEVVDAYERNANSNDDTILGYAVFLKRRRESVMFVSEDKFLRIKAQSELGEAYSYKDIRRLLGVRM